MVRFLLPNQLRRGYSIRSTSCGFKSSGRHESVEESPFEFQHVDGNMTLARKYQDDLIELKLDPYRYVSMSHTPSLPMVAKIYKENQCMSFDITAEPDKIDIHNFLLSSRDVHLDAFEKYLEERGITSTMKFLFGFIDDVDEDFSDKDDSDQDMA